MGTSFWAFEDQGVVPDIVVMGKPLGNGHPIGAVVTTRAIADAFDNGMEFFSTFGGNTVSCAVGHRGARRGARRSSCRSTRARVGERLLAGTARARRPYPDRRRRARLGTVPRASSSCAIATTQEPAGAEASFVANRMRERGILLGTDGPYHNVVKIRPPMPFTKQMVIRC